MKHTFKIVSSMVLENSFGIIDKEKSVELDVTIGFNSDEYGWFEFYDINTGGNTWYAEGGLSFENKELIDYDGVFELPDFIIEKLEELGYDASYAKD